MTRDDAQVLGALVRAAREQLGWSAAELAESAGLDRATTRSLEAGREPRWSTLSACTRTLPGLVPSDLLPGGTGRTPPASGELARFHRRMLSTRARVQHRLVEGGAVEDGLSGLRGRAGQDPLRVLQSACLGGSRVLAQLRLPTRPGERLVVEDEASGTHELTRNRSERRVEFRYARRAAAPLAGPLPESCLDFETALAVGAQAIVRHPVDELRLEVRGPLPARARPWLLAWPAPLVPAPSEDLAPALHPDDRDLSFDSRPGRLRVRVSNPVPGLRYALGWCPGGGPTRKAAPLDLVGRLAAARRAAGLSLRELAARAGVSTMTAQGAEVGRDVRAGTLAGLLAALPGLSAWELLDELEPPLVPSRRRAWAWLRDLHGCEVDEECKLVEVGREGNTRIELQSHGLRRLRGLDAPLVVRLGMARSVLQPTRARLDAVEASDPEQALGLRIRQVQEPGSEPQHQLVVPAGPAADGVDFSRRLLHPGVYTMTDAAARGRVKEPGPFREGSTFGATVPARRLRLIVRFPRGYWPSDFRVHAWALTDVPDSESAGIGRRLHPEGLEFALDRRRRTVELSVEHALPGIKYALGWQLP